MAERPAVDLVVNVFERTYRSFTEPGVFTTLARSQGFEFARRTLLVNNVVDPADARRRAERLLADGEIDEVHYVEVWFDRALEICGLTRAELGELRHYCDAPLTAVTIPGSPWLLYWDAEARLDVPGDWVSRGHAKLCEDGGLLVANPSWEHPLRDGTRPGVERECQRVDGDFAIGHGFSDQVFLARRADLAGPIYDERCIVSLVHPRAHKGRTFEARLNAHMRHHGLMRATYLPASFSIHQAEDAGTCAPTGVMEWARYVRNGAILRAARRSPWRPHCLRYTWIG